MRHTPGRKGQKLSPRALHGAGTNVRRPSPRAKVRAEAAVEALEARTLFSGVGGPVTDPPVTYLSPTDLMNLWAQTLGNSPPSIDDVAANLNQGANSPQPPDSQPPDAPQNVVAAADSDGAIAVNWSDSTSAQGFELDRSTSPAFSANVITTHLPAGTKDFVDQSPAATVLYYYRVRAVGPGGLSDPSATAMAAAMPPPTAIAAGNAQLVTVSWSAVAGASGYELQRSSDGGTAWLNVTVSSTSATLSSDYDQRNGLEWRMLAGASYSYRVVVVDANGGTFCSRPTTVTTAAFRVIDSTSIVSKPDLSNTGINAAFTTSELLQSARGAIDSAAFNAAAGRAARSRTPFIIDIETWKLDVNGSGYVTPDSDGSLPQTASGQVINNLIALVDAIKAARALYPSLQIGFYGTPAWWDGFSSQDWDHASYLWAGYDYFNSNSPTHDARYDLVAQLDFLSPADYLAQGEDVGTWAASSALRISQARKMAIKDGAPAKPAYDFISPYFGGDHNPVAPDVWQLILNRERANADVDGVIIWAAQSAEYGGEGWAGPDNQAWWNVTSDFMTGADGGAPHVPTGLSAGGSRGALSWSYIGPRADGYLIERSPDGINWDTSALSNGPFLAAGDRTQWVDLSAVAGSTYWYRIAAFNLSGTSGWSNAFLLPTVIDATKSTPAVNWSFNSWGNSNFASGVVVGDDSIVGYRMLDLGAGANQLRLNLVQWNIDSLFAGGSIEIYLDHDPTIAAGSPFATIPVGSADATLVSSAIPLIGGVHDVWFEFHAAPGRHYANAGFQWFQFVPRATENIVLNASTSQSTRYYLRLETDRKTLDIWRNATPADGAPSASYLLSSIDSFTINGGGGNTALTVDAVNGSPIPAGMRLNPNLAAAASTDLYIIGTSGDDFLSTYVVAQDGGWDHWVRFNWATIDLGVWRQITSVAAIHYATGGGVDSLGIGNWQTVYVMNNPNGAPARFAAVAIGQWLARLATEANDGPVSSPITIDHLAMAMDGGTDLLGKLELSATLLIGNADIVGHANASILTQQDALRVISSLARADHQILTIAS